MTHNPENLPWVQRMSNAWYSNHPNYIQDPELDIRPLRQLCIWLAKRNGIDLKEPVPMELQNTLADTIERMARYVSVSNKYRFMSLDKIYTFYRQEIMQQVILAPAPIDETRKKLDAAAERTKRLSES